MSKIKHPSSSRRTFLKGAAASTLAFPMILPRSVFGANERLNLAWVGFGGMGWRDLQSCANGNNVVALCDCNTQVFEKGKKKFPDAKYYQDFRIMLAEMGDRIDAVGVGTPDHTHFAVACMAMNMGKHVFVEKPLTHSIWEARHLQQLARKKGLITQMGNQGHASEGARLIKEWYQAGLIGEVKEVIAWTNRPASGVGFSGQTLTAYPAPEEIPAGFDWDLWMGPVDKDIGFSRQLQPTKWRPWWDFGCGGLGDIGCHTIDTPYWAMDLGNPQRVDVTIQGDANPIYTTQGSVVTYHFPAREAHPPVELKWYEGPSHPEKPEGFEASVETEGGLIMVGEEGGIYHDGMRPDSPKLYPEAQWQAYRNNPEKRVAKTLPRTKGIHQDWIQGIQTGQPTCSNFDYAAPLTEVILLGSLAIRTGKPLSWDPESMQINDNPEAAKLVKIPAREGWNPADLG